MQTQINLYSKNNDHTQIMRKMQFCSSFNVSSINNHTTLFNTKFHAYALTSTVDT